MNARAQVGTRAPSSTPLAGGLLQRACACGKQTGSGGECAECRAKRERTLQRDAVNHGPLGDVPPIVHDVLRSPQFLQPTRDTLPSSFTPAHGGLVRRKCASGATSGLSGECVACRTKNLQRKLTIGASNDPLEMEADRIADQVMAAPTQRAVSGAPLHIRRYTRQATEGTDTAPASVDRVVASSGSPLEPTLQQDMEQRFGHDFSRVRVHSGEAAEQSAREVNANAYTVGYNIAFGAGRFAPETTHGRRLIAHELTHVVQQSSFACTGETSPTIIQREKRPITIEEYKRLEPSLQVATWGPDFINGLKRSGAQSQLGDVAMAVIAKGFSEASEHPIKFRFGVMAGIPVGTATAVGSALKSLAEMGWKLAKLLFRLQLNPAAVVSESVEVVKSSTLFLLGNAEQLGLHSGQMIAKEGTKFGIEFFNGSPFDQGYTLGKIIGRIIGEVGLLFIGVGEVSVAAKALANTRYGRLLLEAMEASKLLKPLVESSEAAKMARAANAAPAEAAEAGKALKAAQEAKPIGGAGSQPPPLTTPTTTGDAALDKEIDSAFDKLEAGKGTRAPNSKFDPAKDPHAGPGVRVPINEEQKPANVLDVGAGSRPTDLGLPPERDLVAIERSDINKGAHIDHVFDATKPPPPAVLGKMDAVVINNPRGYIPNIPELGKALKPNGRIIVQGRARIGPASLKNTRGFNEDFQALVDGPAPAGFKKIIEIDKGGLPPSPANTSADILGGPFYKTQGDQRIWPNARLIFERVAEGKTE